MLPTALSKISFTAKLLQLILACTCIALYEHSYKQPYNLLLPITFGGFILICPILIFGVILGQRVPRKLDLLWSFAGMVLFMASGITALQYHVQQIFQINAGIAMGSVAVINAILFLIDLVVTFKDVNQYTPQ